MNTESFNKENLFKLLQTVPEGYVVTYSSLAIALGNKNYARAVGNALHKNTEPEKYPCYKVVNSLGKLSTAYAFGGIEEQARRLLKDGVQVEDYRVNLARFEYKFPKKNGVNYYG